MSYIKKHHSKHYIKHLENQEEEQYHHSNETSDEEVNSNGHKFYDEDMKFSYTVTLDKDFGVRRCEGE